MRFLVDAQLPRAICVALEIDGHSAIHVSDVLPSNAADSEIWSFAKSERFIIVSKDEDFARRALTSVGGPFVVWIRVGNCTNAYLNHIIKLVWPRVCNSLSEGEKLIEIG